MMGGVECIMPERFTLDHDIAVAGHANGRIGDVGHGRRTAALELPIGWLLCCCSCLMCSHTER
jgi:hypothetical protein